MLGIMYLCVQAASFRLSPLMLVDTRWPQPQTQTPAVDQAWSQRRAALQPRSYRGRTPAKRPAPPKPLSGKTGGRKWTHCGGR